MAINLEKGTNEVSEVFSNAKLNTPSLDNSDRGERLSYNDINNSFMYGRMHDMSPAIKQEQTTDSLLNVLTVLFAGQCKKYADNHPDFEWAMTLRELSDVHNEQNYQRFADLVLIVYPALCERAITKNELDSMVLVAAIEAIRGDLETSNLILHKTLVENVRGGEISEDAETFWMFVAIVTDFESWLKLHDGVCLTGTSKYNNKDRQGNPIRVESVRNSNGTSNSSENSSWGRWLLFVGIAFLVVVIGISLSNSRNTSISYEDDNYYEDEEYPDNGNDSYYVIGNSYEVKTNLRVREGPGKDYRVLNRDELAPDDYARSVDSKTTTDALMEEGETVTCLGMEGDWMRIESGWICVYDEGEVLVR